MLNSIVKSLGIMPRPLACVTLACAFLVSCSPSRLSWRPEQSSAVTAYRQSFQDQAGESLVRLINREELLQIVATSQNLWLGDHHRHSRLHALQTELIEQLLERGVAMAFGLEAIGVEDTAVVQDFLADRINLRTLRQRMLDRWHGSWLDDQELDPQFFQALMRIAKQHGIPVFALEPTPRLSLSMRDKRIANSVAQAKQIYPDRLVVTIVGQSHLLGIGDVVHRSRCSGVVIGGMPTNRLRSSAKTRSFPGSFWQADSGLFWFTELFEPP